jgi:hypothetical protein
MHKSVKNLPIKSLPKDANPHKLMEGLKLLIENHPDAQHLIDIMGEKSACRASCHDLWVVLRELTLANHLKMQTQGEGIEKMEDIVNTLSAHYNILHMLEIGYQYAGVETLFDCSAGILSMDGNDRRPFLINQK